MNIQRNVVVLVFVLVSATAGFTQEGDYVSFERKTGYFSMVSEKTAAPVVFDDGDYPGVTRVARNFQIDVERVTGVKPELTTALPKSKRVIIVGTIGKHELIGELVAAKKIDVSSLKGKWEMFITQIVNKPFPGVEQALVIVGSDKRGTIYGLYDLCEHIGVSPWNWWADVPVKKHQEIYVKPGRYTLGEPAVKYRGIFINDEQPALGGWVAQNYGGFKSGFYEKVFDLILRMKGNFLWPAMWGQSFYTDDPLNPKLADEYGVVISTSHHEPLMRAHVEWKKNGGNAWNYQTNAAQLREFWTEGIRRMGTNESVVTLAMRGDGDEPMSEDSNIKLLQKIVEDQRNIIAEVTGKPAEQTPQVWALYKEVQDYYDRGMRVPDDVTLLLCDDNWGNIRKLPKLQEQHNGGYGVYYHFDYVGGPRNYKWLNTNPLPRIWEQMHLAYRYNANKIWVVNVGDIKPMEFPIQFFLDYAWDPTKIPQDKLDDYTVSWATREFGKNYAKDIADIITLYGKYNGRRKPELLGPDSFSPKLYSLHQYREAEMVVNEYNALAERATTLRDKLPAEYHDAYYQLILYPVLACANLNELYYMTRLNRLYAQQGRVEANALAKRVQSLFARDAALANEYNNQMANGKWNHMMDQHHIGYVGWHDDFKVNKLPELNQLDVTSGSEMAVAVEGSSVVWPRPNDQPLLAFDKNGQQQRYIEIFNRKGDPFTFTISAPSSLVISTTGGSVTGQQRVFIKVDWNQIKNPSAEFLLEIKSSSGEEVAVKVICKNPEVPASFKGYVEADGYISIQPEHFSKSVPYGAAEWKVLPDHGRTASAIEVFPVTKSFDPRAGKSPHVQYDINFFNTGKFKIHVMVSPTIDFTAGNGLETAISVDESTPMVLNIHQDNTMRAWEESVKDNIRIISTDITIDKPGRHVLKLWGMDPGVVVQKIIVDTGGLKESYLGPPESNIK